MLMRYNHYVYTNTVTYHESLNNTNSSFIKLLQKMDVDM